MYPPRLSKPALCLNGSGVETVSLWQKMEPAGVSSSGSCMECFYLNTNLISSVT